MVRVFDLGADDYIIKPFRNRELISRIKNVLRRRGHVSKILYCGSVKMFTETTKVFVNGQELSVTIKRIREKLGDREGRFLKTVRGMGYRLEP